MLLQLYPVYCCEAVSHANELLLILQGSSELECASQQCLMMPLILPFALHLMLLPEQQAGSMSSASRVTSQY